MERGFLIGVAGLRWAAWIGLTLVALTHFHRDLHPALVIIAIIATAAVTVTDQLVLLSPRWSVAFKPGLIAVEVAVAALVIGADGWVHQALTTGQTLAGIWPLPAILVAAVAGEVAAGIGVGAVLSGARFVAVFVAAGHAGPTSRDILGAVTTGLSWVVIGAMSGLIIRLLRRAQHQLAAAEAREHIARDLHDGVLQTLAMIERRSESDDIRRLARNQERDLRLYLFGDRKGSGHLATELRLAGARAERAWPSMTVTVTVTDDVPPLSKGQVDAVAGAVTEALTNAAKHGHAHQAVLFADVHESSGGLFVTVKDDGGGFDPTTVVERVGMGRSIRGRIGDLGGSVEFASFGGNGTEVRILVPVATVRTGLRLPKRGATRA